MKPTQTCDPQVLTAWAERMARFVKQLDPNHMVAVGNEGFFDREHDDWFYNGSEGTDQDALAALDDIDFLTFHLYYSSPHPLGPRRGLEPAVRPGPTRPGQRTRQACLLEEIGMDSQSHRSDTPR